MRIPRYWTRATVDGQGRAVEGREGFVAFGWSEVSEAEAEQHALANARRKVDRFFGGERLTHEYPYPNRPLREPVIDRDEAAGWAITRNAYGALVLNSDRVAFIDIDDGPHPRGGMLGRLFGRREPEPPSDPLPPTLRDAAEAMPGMGLKVYRTASGYRALVTTKTYDPAHDLSRDLMGAFGADPQYVALCRAQQSFRARLTPKPWRCGLKAPEQRYPFHDDHDAAAFHRWLAQYEQRTTGHAVCRAITTFGPTAVCPAVRAILGLHDRFTLADPPTPLA